MLFVSFKLPAGGSVFASRLGLIMPNFLFTLNYVFSSVVSVGCFLQTPWMRNLSRASGHFMLLYLDGFHCVIPSRKKKNEISSRYKTLISIFTIEMDEAGINVEILSWGP